MFCSLTVAGTSGTLAPAGGTIDKAMLYEPPFTDLNDQGISGVFDDDADLIKIVKIIDLINENAIVA